MLRIWVKSVRRALCDTAKAPSCGCACGRSLSLLTLHRFSVLSPAPPTVNADLLYHRPHFPISRLNYSTSSKRAKDKDAAIIDSLTQEEVVTLLKVVNEVQQSEDLLKYIIPKKKAEEIMKRKEESEDKRIGSLDQLVSIVGPKSSSKFFCSVLNKPIPISMNAAMFPVVTSEEIGTINNALSIIIAGDKISWCLVHRHLTDKKEVHLSMDTFQQVSYPFKPRMHFLTLLKEMETVISQLPESELYIVEEYPATVPTPYMFNFQLLMAQAKSTVLGLLSARSEESKIISVKTVAVARLFNTYIGSEKVSGQYLVEDMLINKQLPFLQVSDSCIENYKTADVKVKEGLSQAILLNFAYWKMTQQVKI